jgi:subtilisin family serine protease
MDWRRLTARDRRLLTACLVALFAFALPGAAGASVGDEIVVMRDGGLTRAERAEAGVSEERTLSLDDVEVVRAAGDRADALEALRDDPDVVWAEANQPRRLSGEALGGLLWGLHNTGQSVWWRRGTVDADIDAPQAWAYSRGAGLTVAVADTGVDAGHPDLAGKLVPGHDFVDDDADPQDGHGHGTHVASTVAAAENGTGVIGVAPGAAIMPLRVLDDNGGGNSADVAAAFDWAGDRGVRIVNASLGSPYPSQAERKAIRDHPNTLFVVAAGNGGADGVGDDNDDDTREYPCAHEEPNLICVGATDAGDARASFSNYGTVSVDVLAPGQDVVSGWVRGRQTVLNEHFGAGDGFEIMQGTSMASPHVAGAAALAAALRPDWDGTQLKAAVLDGADRLASLAGTSVTGARLNAAGTARIAAGQTGAPMPPEPASLGPEIPAVGETREQQPAQQSTRKPAARISRLRVAGRPRVCRRRGCQARTATVSFALSAEADVTARLQRRRCVRSRCRWRPARERTRRVAAGTTRWVVGQRLLGMALRRGTWRLTVKAGGSSARRKFRVR